MRFVECVKLDRSQSKPFPHPRRYIAALLSIDTLDSPSLAPCLYRYNEDSLVNNL